MLTQCTFSHPISLRFILILYSFLWLGFPSGVYPSGSHTKPCMQLFSPQYVSHVQRISFSVTLSQYLTNLMHKICFTLSFISCLYIFRAHVLIIRRSKLYYTASGIITCKGGRIVHETATCTFNDTRGCVMQFWPPDDEHMCSKNVEAWNKTYCETNFVHQVG